MNAPNNAAPNNSNASANGRSPGHRAPRGSRDTESREATAKQRRSTPGLGVGIRVPTVGKLIWVEVVVAALFVAAVALDISAGVALCVAVASAVLPFVVVAGRPSYDWVGTAVRYVTGWSPSPGVTTDHFDADGIAFGIHRRGDRVSAILEIRPPIGDATRLGRDGATADTTLDLSVLAHCFDQHDITLSGIDIVSHGRRTASGSPATDVYERLIGPLPAVADRTVWVTVTLDVRNNGSAVHARGGGQIGAANTVHIATQRVARALESRNIRSRTLTRSEIRGVASHLCRGVPFDALTEGWRSAPLPGVLTTSFGVDCRKMDTETFAEMWAVPSLSTTVTLRLTPNSVPDSMTMSAACTIVTRTTAPDLRVPGKISMNGRQRQALVTSLPLAVDAPGSADPRRDIADARAAAFDLPTAGCGQLLGSDSSGHGVAARIHGLGVRSVFVAGELYLAQQLVFRAVATGARIVIRTDRPHAWGPLVDSVATPEKLRIDGGPHRADVPFDLVVQDFSDALSDTPRSRADGATVLTLAEHLPGTPMRDPDVTIVQPGAAGDRIHVRTAANDLELMLVTIAQETAFIGRPRSVRSPVPSY